MSFKIIFLIIYSLFLFTYVTFLIQQAIAFKVKFGYLCEASGLGEEKNSRHKFYNIGYFLFGFLSIGFSYVLSNTLPSSNLTNIGTVFIYIASVSLCFIALFPRDRNLKIHTGFSMSLFIGIIVYMICFIPTFIQSNVISKYIVILNVWVPLTLGYYSYLKLRDIKKFGLDNDREPYVSIYEWIPFLSGFLWLVVVSISLVLTFRIPIRQNFPENTNTQDLTPNENTNLISTLNTSMWKRVQLHQNISALIPSEWYGGTDGVYNYDYTKATGPRDTSFPNNSFKCAFYTDENLRSKLNIESEQTLNTEPKVTLIKAKWNDSNSDSLRQLGEEFNFYAFKGAVEEKYIECNVFKGEMLETDKTKLENSILTIK